LGEFLAKRPGKSKQLDEELIENENDPESKRSVFIHMTGTTDKLEFLPLSGHRLLDLCCLN
jgi:hypothetical protein